MEIQVKQCYMSLAKARNYLAATKGEDNEFQGQLNTEFPIVSQLQKQMGCDKQGFKLCTKLWHFIKKATILKGNSI